MTPELFKADFAAKLDAARTDRIVEWDSLPEKARIKKYGRHACGTAYAGRVTATRTRANGILFDYDRGCPKCHAEAGERRP